MIKTDIVHLQRIVKTAADEARLVRSGQENILSHVHRFSRRMDDLARKIYRIEERLETIDARLKTLEEAEINE